MSNLCRLFFLSKLFAKTPLGKLFLTLLVRYSQLYHLPVKSLLTHAPTINGVSLLPIVSSSFLKRYSPLLLLFLFFIFSLSFLSLILFHSCWFRFFNPNMERPRLLDSTYVLVEIPPPTPPHISSPIVVFSSVSESSICHSLAKAPAPILWSTASLHI